jgi:adenylate cyclase class 1
VLKLLLFEVYAADHPAAACLSADYKRAVCAGLEDIDELDPYVMVYRRIECHLQAREQPARLEIVRRCLTTSWHETVRPASQDIDTATQPDDAAHRGGWDAHKLAKLDSPGLEHP